MNAAATLSPTAVDEAHAVLHMTLAAKWPAEGPGLRAVALAALSLDEALRTFRELGVGADGAAHAADRLIRFMTEHCGTGWGDAR